MEDKKSTPTWASLAPEFPTYEVSDTGLVRTTGHNSRVLVSRRMQSGGAPVVFLRRRPDARGDVLRTPRSLSMMVANAFVPNPKGLERVRFKDGDIYNAAADNLEWIDARKAAPVREGAPVRQKKLTKAEQGMCMAEQARFGVMTAQAQRSELFNKYLPAKGVILKPLSPKPDPMPEHEALLIRCGHVSYEDLPQPEQPQQDS